MLEENTLPQAAILATSRKTNDANWRKFSAKYWVPKIFLWFLPLLVVRHCSKLSSYAMHRKTNEPNFPRKIVNQTWKNDEKTNSGPNFVPFNPNLCPNFLFFFSCVLPLLDVRHCRKLSLYAISRKTYDPNSINGEKPHFGPDLRSFSPNLGCQKNF